MRNVYNTLKGLKEGFEVLLPELQVKEIMQCLTDEGELVTEVHLNKVEENEVVQMYAGHSYIDVKFFEELDDQTIAKQIIGDIMVEVANQQLCDEPRH